MLSQGGFLMSTMKLKIDAYIQQAEEIAFFQIMLEELCEITF